MKVLKMADAQLRHKDRSFAFSPLEAINKTLTNAGPISKDEYRDATNYLGQFLHDDADKVIPTILATATILSR
jgi:hypothetical protein